MRLISHYRQSKYIIWNWFYIRQYNHLNWYWTTLFVIFLMDTIMSTSTSQDTLLNQMEAIGIQSTTSMTTLGNDTPAPKGNISNETLQLLESAATKLENPSRGIKRPRGDSTSNDERTNYPTDSKPLYLKTKSLHRRKLALAANIHQIRQGFWDLEEYAVLIKTTK